MSATRIPRGRILSSRGSHIIADKPRDIDRRRKPPWCRCFAADSIPCRSAVYTRVESPRPGADILKRVVSRIMVRRGLVDHGISRLGSIRDSEYKFSRLARPRAVNAPRVSSRANYTRPWFLYVCSWSCSSVCSLLLSTNVSRRIADGTMGERSFVYWSIDFAFSQFSQFSFGRLGNEQSIFAIFRNGSARYFLTWTRLRRKPFPAQLSLPRYPESDGAPLDYNPCSEHEPLLDKSTGSTRAVIKKGGKFDVHANGITVNSSVAGAIG